MAKKPATVNCNKCEDEIERVVSRTTNWPHKAYTVMTNCGCKGVTFRSNPNTNNGLFSFCFLYKTFIHVKCPHAVSEYAEMRISCKDKM